MEEAFGEEMLEICSRDVELAKSRSEAIDSWGVTYRRDIVVVVAEIATVRVGGPQLVAHSPLEVNEDGVVVTQDIAIGLQVLLSSVLELRRG